MRQLDGTRSKRRAIIDSLSKMSNDLNVDREINCDYSSYNYLAIDLFERISG